MANFNGDGEVIGAGGYGVVMEVPDSPYVIKIFKPNVCHSDAKKEFTAHTSIYQKYLEVISKNPELRDLIFIPKPSDFHTCISKTNCYGAENGGCAYMMEKVESGRPDKIQEHLMMSQDYEGLADKIRCTQGENYELTDILTPEQKAICHPRGAFLGTQTIKTKVSLELFAKIPYLFGILFGIVLKAGYYPIDVELVLDKYNRIAMYDFGMVYDKSQQEFEATLELDMYIPLDENSQKLFKQGIEYVSNLNTTSNQKGGRFRKTKRNTRNTKRHIRRYKKSKKSRN